MNNLLFAVLIVAILYYFCYYLPKQKQLKTTKLTQSISTQTDFSNPELEELKIQHQAQLRKINLLFDSQASSYEYIDFNGLYNLLKKVTPKTITATKTTQTEEETELTNTLDTLIRDIQELSNSLD